MTIRATRRLWLQAESFLLARLFSDNRVAFIPPPYRRHATWGAAPAPQCGAAMPRMRHRAGRWEGEGTTTAALHPFRPSGRYLPPCRYRSWHPLDRLPAHPADRRRQCTSAQAANGWRDAPTPTSTANFAARSDSEFLRADQG